MVNVPRRVANVTPQATFRSCSTNAFGMEPWSQPFVACCGAVASLFPKHAQTSSRKFRVNANKRRLDVWLIYHCASCECSWNLEVVARAMPEEIGTERLDAFQRNDPITAQRCAF